MRRIRKGFRKPQKPFDDVEIGLRKDIISKYGLRNRRELLVMQERLRKFRRTARELTAEGDEKKKGLLLGKLERMGLITSGQGLDDVLSLTIENLLERRLQTFIFRRGLAHTPKHARQLITHGHVRVDKRRVKFPSYLVSKAEEKGITVDVEIRKPEVKKPEGASK